MIVQDLFDAGGLPVAIGKKIHELGRKLNTGHVVMVELHNGIAPQFQECI
ncbi:hypothetical protein ACJEDT_02960 [Rhodococcoides fascians]|nr:hypothetical protein [Rhodococcus fascians]